VHRKRKRIRKRSSSRRETGILTPTSLKGLHRHSFYSGKIFTMAKAKHEVWCHELFEVSNMTILLYSKDARKSLLEGRQGINNSTLNALISVKWKVWVSQRTCWVKISVFLR
jgi:hypothetical protein